MIGDVVLWFMGVAFLFGASLITVYLLAHFQWLQWVRPFFCKVLPWHARNYEPIDFDGCSVHARCPWCGYEGMIDSQGNLF
jgi:hypothetical protein